MGLGLVRVKVRVGVGVDLLEREVERRADHPPLKDQWQRRGLAWLGLGLGLRLGLGLG